MKKLVLAGLVAAALGSAALPADAAVYRYVEFAPPAPHYEIVPAPRAGWVWVPGVWEWRGHRHYWVAGHWVRHRPGFVYAPARWVPYHGGWRYHGASWRRHDSDHDGVPNGIDRAPYNPYRY